MVFAPHPDDETLATGGLLQQVVTTGGEVRVIFATNGDNNPWPQRVIEHRWQISLADRVRWGERRRAEALAALGCLGVPASSARFLGYSDQGLTPLLLTGDPEPLVTLAEEIASWEPTLLVTPSSQDRHPDHSALALLLRFALARLRPDQLRFREISYLVHGRQAGHTLHGRLVLPLLPAEQARKRQAIFCHASQLVLSRRRLLAFAQDVEQFFSWAEPVSCDWHHPVCRAVLNGSSLRLAITSRGWAGAFGTMMLSIATHNPTGSSLRLCVTLPRKSAEVKVREASSGAVVARASFSGNRQKGELRLPLSALLPAQRLFVKLTCNFGFFDQAGWREVPVSPRSVRIAPRFTVRRRETWPAPVVCCVIPCYNVARLCGEIVRAAVRYADYVIAIDDGSSDDTGKVLGSIAAENGGRVRVLSFVSNRGKGVALLEGFRYALAELVFDVLVTLDGDRQHRPADIPRLVRAWREDRAALVIGERRQLRVMPLRSRLGNLMTSALLRRMHPASPHDTQSGLRALDRSFVAEVVQIVQGGRYETELDILLLALRQQRHISTVPIPTVYLNGNRSSHFRPIVDSLRIYWTLLGKRGFTPISLQLERNIGIRPE